MKRATELTPKGTERVLVAGSYDPVSLGHMALIDYAAKHFKEVHAVIFINDQKNYFFTVQQRLALLEAACKRYENVKTGVDNGMLFAYAEREKIDYTIRGYRDEKDLAYEAKMAEFNEKALPGLETILVESRPEQRTISSTKIREFAVKKGDFAPYVPAETLDLLQKFIEEKRCQKM